MGKAQRSSHAPAQLYAKHYVSLTDYHDPVANDYQTRPPILSPTHRRCQTKPNLRILPLLL